MQIGCAVAAPGLRVLMCCRTMPGGQLAMVRVCQEEQSALSEMLLVLATFTGITRKYRCVIPDTRSPWRRNLMRPFAIDVNATLLMSMACCPKVPINADIYANTIVLCWAFLCWKPVPTPLHLSFGKDLMRLSARCSSPACKDCRSNNGEIRTLPRFITKPVGKSLAIANGLKCGQNPAKPIWRIDCPCMVSHPGGSQPQRRRVVGWSAISDRKSGTPCRG